MTCFNSTLINMALLVTVFHDMLCFCFRFLDIADLIPQMNPGGTGRILKPEFKQMLNKLMFYMEDTEFEKLWKKYDSWNSHNMVDMIYKIWCVRIRRTNSVAFLGTTPITAALWMEPSSWMLWEFRWRMERRDRRLLNLSAVRHAAPIYRKRNVYQK